MYREYRTIIVVQQGLLAVQNCANVRVAARRISHADALPLAVERLVNEEHTFTVVATLRCKF